MRLTIPAGQSETLLEALKKQGLMLPSPCAGTGQCGKCRILVLSGTVPPTGFDIQFLTSAEIEHGIRLACHAVPRSACVVEVDDPYMLPVSAPRLYAEDISEEPVLPDTIVSAVEVPSRDGDLAAEIRQKLGRRFDISLPVLRQCGRAAEKLRSSAGKRSLLYILHDSQRIMDISVLSDISSYGIAIDLGTTAIQVQLVNLITGEAAAECGLLNPQAGYGADVLLRIQAAQEGKLEELSRLAGNSICRTIMHLCGEAHISPDRVHKVVLAGNTVMFHILLALNCSSLGRSSFISVTTDLLSYPFEKVFENTLCDCPVFFLPGISVFVGSDILAGLTAAGFYKISEPVFFIDIGTNGEMALALPGRIFCTSAAAGPAFEGGRVSCGAGGGMGALLSAELRDGKLYSPRPDTAGNMRGLSGSALVDAVAIALEQGWITAQGEVCAGFEQGIPVGTDAVKGQKKSIFYITQKDIRELQLASAAIRAAIETLIRHAGIQTSGLARVYLAGAFGCAVNGEHAVRMGLLPPEFLGKIVCMGNASLHGARTFLCRSKTGGRMETIREQSHPVQLADLPEFSELFIKYMTFPQKQEL